MKYLDIRDEFLNNIINAYPFGTVILLHLPNKR